MLYTVLREMERVAMRCGEEYDKVVVNDDLLSVTGDEMIWFR